MKLSNVKKLVYTAVCTALCLVLPLLFHSVPNAGAIFSPMHIPVLLCGLACGWPWGAVCGLLGPLVASISGMPPLAKVPNMAMECATYGLVAGLMMKYVRTKFTVADLYISIITAMAMGRVVNGLAKTFIFAPGTPPFAWVTTSLITGIPGIVMQLIVVPVVVLALTRAKLIPQRYPKQIENA